MIPACGVTCVNTAVRINKLRMKPAAGVQTLKRLLLVGLLAIIISGCATKENTSFKGRMTDPDFVVKRIWQWEATITGSEKREVENPERYTILLTDEGKVQARFDCNRGGGDYVISQGVLSFGPLISTRMACPPGTMDAQFMRDLQDADSFYVEDGKLFITVQQDKGLMQFRRAW